ncbi:MAG: helix-turn-helix transcriptional regulator [Acidimicrobiales bacterium]
MLSGRSGLSPVMVGRSAELDRLTRMLVSGGGPEVAVVGGEAGVGKTRLVQELIARVPPGTRVLAGQADPGSLGRPLEMLLDAVSGQPGVDEDLLADVADRSRRSDERVLAGVELVRKVAAGLPVVVVFEDLHWADSESIALFERLADPEGEPVLLVGTYRPDALTRRHPAGELLPRLERRHSVTHLRLDRLSPSDVGAFLASVYGRPPTYRVVEALHSRTGGNPFFLEELLAAAGGRAAGADVEQLMSQPLPWTLAEVIRGQLDDLQPHERRVAEAAAVLGRKIPFDLLATVTRTTEDELIDVLRTLVERGLMVETEADVFSFRHALAREAIESALLGRERRRLHQAALDALREAGSIDFAAQARHAYGAGRFDDMVAAAREGALRYLELGSSFQALLLAELALSEIDADLDLLALASRAAWLAGLLDDAGDHTTHWLDTARRVGDIEGETAALQLQVRLAFEGGDLAGMASATNAVEATLDRLPEEARGRAMATLAQSYMLRDNCEEACRWADLAMTIADKLDLPDLRVAALVEKGSAIIMRPGRGPEGGELLLTVAEEAERLGEHLLASRAFNNVVWHARSRLDLTEVRGWVERMRDHAERAGYDSGAGAGYAQTLAEMAAYEGDLDAAIARLDEGRRRDRGYIGHGKGLSYTVAQAGFALEAGDLEAAARYTAEAKPPVEKSRIAVAGLDFNLACRRGDLDAARDALADLIAVLGTGPDEVARMFDTQTAHDLVSPALKAGLDPDELRPLVERARDWAYDPLTADKPWARMLHAQLAEAEGRVDAALEGYEHAVEHLPMNFECRPSHRGTAHVGAARCLITLGRLDDARVHAAEARRLLARWRGWRVEELEAIERRLRLGEPVSGSDALTPREREVVVLVAEGLTNAQLAGRMYISPKTAAVHVSNILAKLGMESRAEVAAWAVREGFDGKPDATLLETS